MVWPGCAIYASRVPDVELNVSSLRFWSSRAMPLSWFIPVAVVRLGHSAGLSAPSVVSKGWFSVRFVRISFWFLSFFFFLVFFSAAARVAFLDCAVESEVVDFLSLGSYGFSYV